MCNFQVLHMCSEGYVVSCKKCKNYQVAFNTSLVYFSHTSFKIFIETVEERIEEYLKMADESMLPEKSIYVPTTTNGHWLILTLKEAQRLLTILHEADAEAQTQNLLAGFYAES